jgi:hypothetical protein
VGWRCVLLHACVIPERGVSEIGQMTASRGCGCDGLGGRRRGLPDDSQQDSGTGLAAGSAVRAVNGQLAGMQH